MEVKKHRIGVYGVEIWNNVTFEDVVTSQYEIHFVSGNSSERLSDYDSAIVLQGRLKN